MQPANARLAVLTLSLTLTLTKAATAHRVTDLLEHQWTSLSEPAVLPLTTEPMPEPLLRTTARWKGAMASGRWPLGLATPRTPRRDRGQGTGACRGQGPAGDRGPGTARLAWAAEPAPRRGHMHAATAPATYGCSPRHLRLQASTTPRMRSRCGLSPYLSSGSYPGSPHMTRPCPCR